MFFQAIIIIQNTNCREKTTKYKFELTFSWGILAPLISLVLGTILIESTYRSLRLLVVLLASPFWDCKRPASPGISLVAASILIDATWCSLQLLPFSLRYFWIGNTARLWHFWFLEQYWLSLHAARFDCWPSRLAILGLETLLAFYIFGCRINIVWVY